MGKNTFRISFDDGTTKSVSVEIVDDYVCKYCDDEITLDQIKKTIGGTVGSNQITNINKVLPFINKYRKDFGLDTCLKKAHFLAQITHESDKFNSLEEYERWNYRSENKATGKIVSLPGVFSNTPIEFDETMGESLKEYLTEIFTIKDDKDKVLTKTNDEIKKLLLDNKVKVVDKKLYTNYQQGEELLKEVKEKKEDGTETEVIKFKIYLKSHSHFGIPLLSRMYAPYKGDRRGLGNGDELSKDGWKYKGRGLKQLTGIDNYKNFTKYRNGVTFTDDTSGKIDFEKNDDLGSPQDAKKGNYVKVSEPMYAVQSALWFWNKGSQKDNKYAVEHAENDDVNLVSKAVNAFDTENLAIREGYYNNARKKDAIDIVRHHTDIYDNGTDEQKKTSKAYFEKWKDKDDEAKKKLEEINKAD
ncbi:hypothetical protein BZG01_15190 [Labilibaculum manganireducens]|uniref:Glycoside hydrolase family 19 catalytic domain-containing protein n=1 Tax=Labilibaculum manganireducens TaxID=1940525 RepID=A0A2N3I148_9BACT|nr:hypothetical protein [Labilibaculum manganireducens]PKQ64038.1 hypothetical protein BZG01_15190 [Labilibaculum manganireducens]